MKIVKGLPFLAMGGVTLGLVGATVLAPVVKAANPFEQTVTANVSAGLSVDINDNATGSDATNIKVSMAPQKVDESKSATVSAAYNNGNFTLTMKGKDASADLVKKGEATRKFVADGNIKLDRSAWGVKFTKNASTVGGDAHYQAVPGSTGTALTIADGTNTKSTTKIQYGFSTAADMPTGDYTTTVVYTAAAN